MLDLTEVERLTFEKGFQKESILKFISILKSGKKRYGSPGASLTHQFNPKKDDSFKRGVVEKGIEGERKTSNTILKWMEGKENVLLFNSVHIKGAGNSEIDPETGLFEGGDTDHVVLMGDKVILIDSKMWKSRRRYSVSDKGFILRNERGFPGGRVNAGNAKRLWKSHLNTNKVASYICVSAEKTFVMQNSNWYKQSYRLVTLENLTKFLDKEYKTVKNTPLKVYLAVLIASNLVKPYNKYKRLFGDRISLFQQ